MVLLNARNANAKERSSADICVGIVVHNKYAKVCTSITLEPTQFFSFIYSLLAVLHKAWPLESFLRSQTAILCSLQPYSLKCRQKQTIIFANAQPYFNAHQSSTGVGIINAPHIDFFRTLLIHPLYRAYLLYLLNPPPPLQCRGDARISPHPIPV